MGAKVFYGEGLKLSGQALFWSLSLLLAIAAYVIEVTLDATATGMTLVFPLVLTCFCVAAVGYWAVPLLRALKAGQFIREDGPQAHLAKAGTPTMGGLFFVPVAVVIGLVCSGFSWNTVAVSLLTLAYGFIGWLDDWQVIRRRSNKGISPRTKLLLQIVVAGLFTLWLWWMAPDGITTVQLPLGWSLSLGLLFWPLAGFVPVAQSNATNLTDGIDGLAAGTGAIAFLGLAALTLPSEPGLAIFCASMAGGCLGFLSHNRNPARVFMGDTGSLALGGSMAAIALLSQNLFGLLVIGGVFLIETLSVMAQVSYYKATKDENGIGRRLFKMAPFHHHLELCGWSETQVVVMFYLLGAVLATTVTFTV
ncbi:MAG: phospho-N-acetylmuramoyl-pentapeptide-transferase [Elainellaceae cyanobacterium]